MNWALIGLTSLWTATGLGQVDPARIVATVNGEEVKGSEYYRYMEYMDLNEPYGRFRNMIFSLPTGYLALDQIITNKLLAQLAKSKNVFPVNAEIDAEFQAFQTENAEGYKDWKEKGRTDFEMKERLKNDLVTFKLQTQGITVTDQEIDAFYKDNIIQFTIPKLYKLRVIVATDEPTKSKIDAALATGKAFADVARELSDDITKVSGGEYGQIAIENLPKELQDAIRVTKIGASTQWVVFQKNNVKFYVEDVTPEKVKPLDAKLRKSIRRSRMMDIGKNKNDLLKLLSDFRKTAKVEIRAKEFAEIYRKLMEVETATRSGAGG